MRIAGSAGWTLLAVGVLAAGLARAETATSVTCKDGTTAKSGRGACKGHGGVAKSDASASEEAATAPPAGMVTCKDGTTSKGGKGACRGHGGVGESGSAATGAPAATPNASGSKQSSAAASGTSKGASSGTGKAANTDPSGALAKCHDGMYWHGTVHSGACSHHGGVDSWLDKSKE